MCGILGQIDYAETGSSRPQLSLLHHRGPDGQGEWTNPSGTVYLGHTRLAILEPTPAGRQPMSDAAGRFTLTFNGEIYNHLHLRPLLPYVHWRGGSDTETLVELLAAKGLEALGLLKGMFAFAVHDAADDSVVLVRDRLGIKPLYLRSNGPTWTFASEVRPLLQPGEFMPTQQALSEYVGFGRMPSRGDIFPGVQEVQPGSWVRLQKDRPMERESWWPKGLGGPSRPERRPDCVKRVNHLVSTAIEEHLISDVGVGAFLSGGIDSSIVALVAGKALGRSLQTFTVGFPQAAWDERAIARRVAQRAGSEHCEVEVNESTCLNWVKEAVLNLDLPSVDAINTFIVSKAVRMAGLKVALSGQGGDELFGGYPSFRNIPYLKWLNALPHGVGHHLINVMPQSLQEKLGGLPGYSTPELTVARRRFTSVNTLRAMGLGIGTPLVQPAPAGLDTQSKISWGEIQGYLIPMLLRDSDQMSMATGLEIRVPFLDHCLVEAVLRIPQKYKKGPGVKPLLVDAFRSELPVDVYDRPKQGYALPMRDWMNDPLAEFTREGVQAAADLLHQPAPLHQLTQFTKGVVHWTRVWHWCVLGHWLLKQQVPAYV